MFTVTLLLFVETAIFVRCSTARLDRGESDSFLLARLNLTGVAKMASV